MFMQEIDCRRDKMAKKGCVCLCRARVHIRQARDCLCQNSIQFALKYVLVVGGHVIRNHLATR